MSRLVEPIEEENGRCRTVVILDEAERQPQRTRAMRRQLRQLFRHIDEDFMSPYRERILRALGSHKVRYVPGADIDGTDLYEFPLEPRLTAPLHCMLCGDGFASDAALEKHVVDSHVSMAEYRKRVLFKYEKRGPQAVTPSEKKEHGAELRSFPAILAPRSWQLRLLRRTSCGAIRGCLRNMRPTRLEGTPGEA